MEINKENIKSSFFPENKTQMKAITTLDMNQQLKSKKIFNIIKYEKCEYKNEMQPL